MTTRFPISATYAKEAAMRANKPQGLVNRAVTAIRAAIDNGALRCTLDVTNATEDDLLSLQKSLAASEYIVGTLPDDPHTLSIIWERPLIRLEDA
jgi:hypothetical protein